MVDRLECPNGPVQLTNVSIMPAERAADLRSALATPRRQYGRGSGAVVASTLRPFDAMTSRYHFPESLIVRACVS